MGEDDFLTFQELGKIRKKAKNNNSLQELDESFLKNLRDYLDRKKRLSGKLNNKEYRNAKRIAEDIIDLRELKILKRAALAAKSNISIENLLKEEEPLFEKVKNSIVLHREIIQNTIEGEIDSLEDPDPKEKDEVERGKKVSKSKSGREDNVNGEKALVKNESEEAGENLKEEEEKTSAGESEKLEEDENTTDIPESKGETKNSRENSKKEKEAKSKNREDKKEREKDTEESKESEKSQEGGESYKKVKITSDLSEFLGTDMKSYGPLEKGEKVKLPEENARVLLDRGKAEKIKIKE